MRPAQVSELYKNCIKLASENKISAKNTWSLPLIDHMSDLVKPSVAERDQTNFQRASCTLETVRLCFPCPCKPRLTTSHELQASFPLARGSIWIS